jgi:hypothetical protein
MASRSALAPEGLPPARSTILTSGGGEPGNAPLVAERMPPSTGAPSSAPAARGASTIERMVIKVAHLDLVTSEPQQGFDKAVLLAKAVGGYTLNSRHEDRRSTVTLRVPAGKFEDTVQRLTELGKVDRRQVTGTDVTAEFVDVKIRLLNAESVRQRYVELLQKTGNVADALAVQRELERVTTSIEQLKGRLVVIQNQVTLSTIHLSLEKPTRPGPVGWIFYGLYHMIRWLFVWT